MIAKYHDPHPLMQNDIRKYNRYQELQHQWDSAAERADRFGEPSEEEVQHQLASRRRRDAEKLAARASMIEEGEYADPPPPDPDHAPWEGGGE